MHFATETNIWALISVAKKKIWFIVNTKCVANMTQTHGLNSERKEFRIWIMRNWWSVFTFPLTPSKSKQDNRAIWKTYVTHSKITGALFSASWKVSSGKVLHLSASLTQDIISYIIIGLKYYTAAHWYGFYSAIQSVLSRALEYHE